MASVYLAVQESFGREVALKIMSEQLGQDDVWAQRFMHEARIVAQLSHSNIVPVFDVGSHEGRFYISMELLKGGKLDDRMAKGLGVPEAIKIVCGVAAGLDYAGAKGFVHRDIKPDNVMFRDDGTPVILDFGIAKQKDGDSKMTKTGTIVGTTGYMSPEQAMGQELDERSDIYSLGIMLYELLTGHVPFRGDSAVAVLLKHVQETPPPLPPQLALFQPVLDKALAKKPEERYQRASEMIEHLQELLALYKQQNPTGKTAPVAKPVSSTEVTAIATAVAKPVTAQQKTAVNAPVAKKNSMPLIAAVVIGVLVIAAGVGWKLTRAPLATAPATPAAVAPAPVVAPVATPVPPVVEPINTPAPDVAPAKVEQGVTETPKAVEAQKSAEPAETPAPTETGNRRAVLRILEGAHECMKNKQYDCAKSKAEAALDLEPDNLIAKRILANAKKAQQDAFSGDWNAK